MMTNGTDIYTGISMNGRKLEKVTSFKYLHGRNPVQGWHLLSKNPHQDCLSNVSRIWQCNAISFASKFEPYQSCYLHSVLWQP